jgi:hypothetical protein
MRPLHRQTKESPSMCHVVCSESSFLIGKVGVVGAEQGSSP